MLDLFFEKYAWTANLVLLFAAAWLSAKTINTAVGAVIRPKPQAQTTGSVAPPATPRLARLESDKLYTLVGQKPPAAPTDPQAAQVDTSPKNCNDPSSLPVKSGLRVQLVAGAVAFPPESSLASILDLNTRETHLYSIGDQIQGATLLAVERRRGDSASLGDTSKVVAVICNRGTKEYVDFDPGDGSSAPAAPNIGVAPVPSPGPTGPPGAPVRMAENRYQVPKSFIDSNLSNLNAVATQARIFPNFKNGSANGFRVVQIQPGSLYSSIGIENGDVIQRINGYEMNSPEKALEIYQKLRESSHISLEVERNGQVIRKEYNVTP